MTDLILPTDEQVERAARTLCISRGLDPDGFRTITWSAAPDIMGREEIGAAVFDETNLEAAKPQARENLVLLLNKDKILGGPTDLDHLAAAVVQVQCSAVQMHGKVDPEAYAEALDIPDTMPGLREITKRQRQFEAIESMCDIHSSVCNEDGTVRNINREPVTWWRNSPIALTVDQLSPPYAHLNMSPTFALTDQHVAALEHAIRAEGFSISTDTESGEIKLERILQPGNYEIRGTASKITSVRKLDED